MPSIEIVGPSGAGKSTLMNALIMYGEGAVRARLSTTTRAARTSGHVPGEYWHVSEALLDHLNEPTQRKLAWVVGAHGARYATQCTALQASLENGAMTSVAAMVPQCIEPSYRFAESLGLQNRMRYIWLEAPEEVCKARMLARGDDPKKIDSRIEAERAWPSVVADLERTLGITFTRIDGTKIASAVLAEAVAFLYN